MTTSAPLYPVVGFSYPTANHIISCLHQKFHVIISHPPRLFYALARLGQNQLRGFAREPRRGVIEQWRRKRHQEDDNRNDTACF